ncbi:MAG: 30S ribosome-binding factor RbfA [Chitinivibrionales bacterium]|nr:30S ribosome-binding factor RbfA [Chitinivibrionales bacterium]MBD3395493.1 30S ribosome-binding factor RbfA [Chitinivibrionales bacterium]
MRADARKVLRLPAGRPYRDLRGNRNRPEAVGLSRARAMTATWYSDRIKEELSRKIAWVIAQKLRDPRIPPVVTVTDLTVAPDMSNATVYVSVFGEEKTVKGALIALNRAAPFIQKVVSHSLSVRRFPKLHFRADSSLAHGQRINELLEEVKDDLEQA